MSMFQLGSFTLSSGDKSWWRINSEFLTKSDLTCIAEQIVRMTGPFSEVHGVPRGGTLLAKIIDESCERFKYSDAPILVVDDVYTTGRSLFEYLKKGDFDPHNCKLAVIWARTTPPSHVHALWTLNTRAR